MASIADTLSDLIDRETAQMTTLDLATPRVSASTVQIRLEQFRAEHRRRVDELKEQLERVGTKPERGKRGRQIWWRAKNQLQLIITNDRNALRVLAKSEARVRQAYGRALHRPDLPPELRTTLEQHRNEAAYEEQWLADQISIAA